MNRTTTVALGLLCGLLCGGCAAVQERPYPPDWPPLATPGSDCSGIGGRYADRGTLADERSARSVASLSAILSDEPPERTSAVSISVTRDRELIITAFDAARTPARVNLRKDMAFTCNSGTATIAWAHGSLDPLAVYYESKTITLHRAVDGALVVNQRYTGRGYVFLVPFADSSSSWARFPAVGE